MKYITITSRHHEGFCLFKTKETDYNSVNSHTHRDLLVSWQKPGTTFKRNDLPVYSEPVFWEHEGNKAVRLCKYKMVMAGNKNKPEKWELYDMETDWTEMHDLSGKFPEKVKEMKNMWENWSKRAMDESCPKVVELEKK